MSVCDNCLTPLDKYEDAEHRCRADENSCWDGKECPDYVETCDCEYCGNVLIDLEKQPTVFPEDETLYILQVDDMIGCYEEMYGSGSYSKLTEKEKETLKHSVKSSLGHGLGEAWVDYMETAIKISEGE